jgi:hypothetical protein
MLRLPEVDVDYGRPLTDNFGRVRNYTKADIAMDCNTWTGSLDTRQK